MDLKEVRWVDADWLHLASDRDRWRGLMHTIMTVGVALIVGNFLAI
jgi:hypothetical protein